MRRRPRRSPGYLGVVYWGFLLAMFAYAAFNSGLWWGVAFGVIWIGLLAACLWFYGVIPFRRPTDDERA